MLLFVPILIALAHAAPSREALALRDFFLSDEILYAEPFSWVAELARMSPARQDEVARELRAMVPAGVANRAKIFRMTIADIVVNSAGSLTRQFVADAERIVALLDRSNALRLIEAQNKAIVELGLPSVAWVLRGDNKDYRRRWDLKVDQLLRHEATRERPALSGVRFEAWRAGWRAQLRAQKSDLARDTLRVALVHGIKGRVTDKPRLIAEGHAPRELTAADLISGVISHAGASRSNSDPFASWAKAEWTLTLPSGTCYGIFGNHDLPFGLNPERFDAIGLVTRTSVLAFAARLSTSEVVSEINQVERLIDDLPAGSSGTNVLSLIQRRSKEILDGRPTVADVTDRMSELRQFRDGEANLRDLLADLRLWRGVQTDANLQWPHRHLRAIAAGRSRFSLRGMTSPASAPALAKDRLGGGNLDPNREVYTARTAYEVRGHVDDDSFHLHDLTKGNANEWNETSPTGAPHGFELRPLESVDVRHGIVALPTALNHELTRLEVTTDGERRLTPGREYLVMRNSVTGSYTLRILDASVASVRVRAGFAIDRSAPVTLPDVPLALNAPERLARLLRSGRETELATALDARDFLSARALNELVRTHTLYSYAQTYNEAEGFGPLAEFSRFLDEQGRYCVQCQQVAHLLARLLNETLPTGYSAEVASALLRNGTSLALPTHAVVDVYRGAKLVLRLNPVSVRRDPRAPTAAVARELAARARNQSEARNLDRTLETLSRSYGDLSLLPVESPLRRAYRLTAEVRAAFDQLEFDRASLIAHVNQVGEDILRTLPRWTMGVPYPGRRERRITGVHLSAEAELNALVARLRNAVAEPNCAEELSQTPD